MARVVVGGGGGGGGGVRIPFVAQGNEWGWGGAGTNPERYSACIPAHTAGARAHLQIAAHRVAGDGPSRIGERRHRRGTGGDDLE